MKTHIFVAKLNTEICKKLMRVCNTWHENKEECKRARTPASSNNLLNFNSRHLTRKIYQKGGKEKKTIKRNKYFRKIKGSNYTYDF